MPSDTLNCITDTPDFLNSDFNDLQTNLFNFGNRQSCSAGDTCKVKNQIKF